MIIKKIVSKLFPRFYLSLALAKREVWDEYQQLREYSDNCMSPVGVG